MKHSRSKSVTKQTQLWIDFAVVRLVINIGLRDHVTPGLQQLHWLSAEHRITFKLCMLMHLIHIGRAPRYMAAMCSQSWNPAVDPV